MSSKTTYYNSDGSVTFDPTLIITGTETPSRIEQLERENAALREELNAQAVVNGKGGEREAKLLAENAALNETAKKHVAAYYELLEKVRRLQQDLSITRQRRCHDIVESEKKDV